MNASLVHKSFASMTKDFTLSVAQGAVPDHKTLREGPACMYKMPVSCVSSCQPRVLFLHRHLQKSGVPSTAALYLSSPSCSQQGAC